MYTLTNFNRDTGIITFIRDNDHKEFSINCKEFRDYRGVTQSHYIEINTGNIILNNLPTRVIVGEPDNLYKRAKQSEFDLWHTTLDEYMNTDNAKVYNLIMNS
jgi:hypothetical protein